MFYHAGVAAARNQHQALRRIQYQRLILRNRILDQPRRCLDLSSLAPIPFWKFAWYRAGKPGSRKELRSSVALDEFPPARLKIFPDRDHDFSFTRPFRPAEKHAASNT